MVQIPNEDFGSLRQQSLSEKPSITAAELLPLLRECEEMAIWLSLGHRELTCLRHAEEHLTKLKAAIERLESEVSDDHTRTRQQR